jgi:dTDP-glucose 4,6-dehydratase
MTRLFLSGAGGFAGHHFLEHVLTTTDWDVVATDSFRHRGTCDRISQVLDGGPPTWPYRVDVVTHDLTAPFSPQQEAVIAGKDGLDYIVAMASLSHVDTSLADPAAFIANNVAVVLSQLELARRLNPRAFVLISTDEVYGPVPELAVPHREWSTLLPSNPYSASKASQEAAAISYWRSYGVPLIITNTMNLIGERQHPEKMVPKTIRAVLAGTEAVIHGSPGNVGTRHYLHARNMADAVLFLLRTTVPSVYSGRWDIDHASASYRAEAKHRPYAMPADRPDRYNVASPDRISNLDLAAMIADAAGKPLHWRFEDFHTTRPGHDAHYGLDPAKIGELGWKAPVPFDESLRRTVRWTMANPEWLMA